MCLTFTRRIIKNGPASVVGDSKEDGVFVPTVPKFVITDGLQVARASTRILFPLIEKYGILEKENIQEKVLQLNYANVCLILSPSLSPYPFRLVNYANQ